MIFENKLLEEDVDNNIYLIVSPESTEQIRELLVQIGEERPDLKVMDTSYYEFIKYKWRDKLHKYPLAVSQNQPFFTFYGINVLIPLVFLEELKLRYKEIELSCLHRKSGTELPLICHFVTKNTSVLNFTKSDEDPENSYKKIPFDKTSILRDIHDRLIDFKAKFNGYLLYGEKGLQIIPPLINIINPYALTLRLIPMVTGISDLVEFINAFLKNHREKYPNSPIMDETFSEKTLQDKGMYSYQEIEIVRGIEPQEGRDSRIFLTKEDPKYSENDQRVDHHHLSQIFTVSEGDVIAKKELARKGIDGLDIYGKIFPVKKGTDKILKVDDNIRVERYEKEFQYLAKMTGIVIFKENALSLEETMLIKGDVDYHTGNISYEKNIYILGDVRSGFEVNCQGNIIIEGSVEDNVQIKCDGSLKIIKGILGEKTQIYCKNDLFCSFIERATVVCLGNLNVNRYILGGRISSMGDISILGQDHSTKKVGALSGSECRCYQNLLTFSLGANANNTQIYLGYNCLIEEKLFEVDKMIKGMQIRVSQFVEKIPFDLTSPGAINKLKQSDKATRDSVRALLVGIKESNKEIEELQNSRQELKNRRYTENTSNFSIDCKEGIKGPISVIYNDSQKNFSPRNGNFRIKYNDFEECLEMV